MSEAFLPGVLLLLLLAALFVVLPLRRATTTADGTRQAINKRVLKEQLADLEQQHGDGVIDAQTLQALRDELFEEAATTLEAESGQAAVAGKAGWPVVGALLLALVLGSSLLYRHLGAQQELQLAQLTENLMAARTAAQRDSAFAALVPALESYLQDNEHAQYRFLLAQAQTQQQAFAKAAANYKQLLGADGESAELLALFAQASYLANERKLNTEAAAALAQALEINPVQTTALGLRGMSAFEGGDYALAVQSWERLLATMPAGSPQAQTIQQALAGARARMPAAAASADKPAAADAASSVAAQAEATAAGGISVRVDASAAARRGGDTVFIYARAEGARMPLAIVRKPVGELPLTVQLDDSQAMMPALKLSQFQRIEVLARISASGNAIAQPGDWQASSGVIEKPADKAPLKLHIDTQVK